MTIVAFSRLPPRCGLCYGLRRLPDPWAPNQFVPCPLCTSPKGKPTAQRPAQRLQEAA